MAESTPTLILINILSYKGTRATRFGMGGPNNNIFHPFSLLENMGY